MRKVLFVAMLAIALLVAACAAPTVEPTKAPTATSAPAAPPSAPTATVAPTVAPTVAATKPPAPTTAPTAPPAPTTAPVVTPKSGGILKVILMTLPATYGNLKDKSQTIGNTGYFFPVVETLVGMTKDGPAPTKLATSWDIAPDGKSITFKLRQGVKFHDGTDFNAKAVKWNVEKIQGFREELKVISSIDVPDPYTVRFNLSSFSNSLLYHLSWFDGVMVSPDSVDGRDAKYVSTHVVGTGPFELVSFTQETNAVFKKFAGYWDKGKPYLDGMEYVVVKDNNTARSAFLTGQAQAWDYCPTKEAVELKAQKYLVNTVPGLMRVGLGDSANPDSPFAKKEVRWAVEYAVDKQALADVLGAGLWEVPPGPCSILQLGCSAITPELRRTYDPAKAKQLLAQAGYPQGFKTTLTAPGSVGREIMVAIQGYLKAVGIDAEVEIPEMGKITTLRTEGWRNGMLVQGLGISTASYVQALETDGPSPTKAHSALVSPEYSALLKKASAAVDPAEQKKLSEQLAKLVHEEAVLVPFAVESRHCVYYPTVHTDLDTISVWFWNPGDSWIDK